MACTSIVRKRSRITAGFTLVEVLVIAPIIMISITVMVAVMITLTGEVMRIQGTNATVNDVQSALDQIEADTRLSIEFPATSYIPVAPQGITGTTDFNGSGQFTVGASYPAKLIVRSHATTRPPLALDRKIVNRSSPVCTGPNAIPYTVDIVYYLKDNSLWRRTIDPTVANSGYSTANNISPPCSTPWQLPSCSPGYTNTAICKTEDTEVAKNVSSLTIDFLNSTGVSLGSTPTAAATAVKVTLATTNSVAGRTDTVTSQSQTSKLYSTTGVAPSWNTLSLQSPWVNFGSGYSTAAYTITSSGVVVLKGLVARSGTPAISETIGVLPPGYRPSKHMIFMTSTNPNVASRVDISVNGEVQFVIGSGGWIALDGITFLPPSSTYTVTAPTLLNSWVNFDASYYTPAGYTTDRSGRTHLQGLIRSGTATDGTPITSSLPANRYSDKYLHIPASMNNGYGAIGVSGSNIQAKGGTNSYLSLNTMFYPSSYSGSWTTLAPYAPAQWVPYDINSYPPIQYIKGSDGIVSLRGLIRSGQIAAGTGIARLPEGYRPKEQIVVNLANAGVYARIDIRADGWIIAQGINNNAWLSLDGIDFIGEQ